MLPCYSFIHRTVANILIFDTLGRVYSTVYAARHSIITGETLPTPRNSDEEPDWDDDNGYIDLTPLLQRLDLVEDTLFDNPATEHPRLDSNETTD